MKKEAHVCDYPTQKTNGPANNVCVYLTMHFVCSPLSKTGRLGREWARIWGHNCARWDFFCCWRKFQFIALAWAKLNRRARDCVRKLSFRKVGVTLLRGTIDWNYHLHLIYWPPFSRCLIPCWRSSPKKDETAVPTLSVQILCKLAVLSLAVLCRFKSFRFFENSVIFCLKTYSYLKILPCVTQSTDKIFIHNCVTETQSQILRDRIAWQYCMTET